MATKPKTTKVSKLTNPSVGTQAQRDAINANIAKLNKSLAGGITGVKNTDGSTIKGKVYFTDKGATDKSGKTTYAPKGGNTTGITPNPKNTDATDAGVISSEQGVSQFKQYQSDAQKLDVGLGTKDSPLSESQILAYEQQGIREGDTVAGKGVLKPGGYFEQPVSEGKIGGVDTGTEPTATYINPETGATTTTTGASAGSPEEQAKMQEKGMSLSESSTKAEDLTDPEIKKAEDEYTALTKEITSYKNRLLDLIITDADLKADIRGITSAYNARIAEMRNITDRQIQSIKTLGYRQGMQFTGGMGGVFGGIISNAEQEGLLKVADIEGQKQETIIKAKAAARDNNYKIYASLMEDARSLATQKATALADLKKAQKEQDALIAQQKKDMINEALIVDAYTQGFTTPAEIASVLGGNVSLDVIEKSMKILNPPDKLKGLDSDYQTYAYLQSIGDPSVDGITYPQYVQMMGNLKRAPEKDTSLKEEEKFDADIQKGQEELQKGTTWAAVWNRLYTKYSTGNEEQNAALRDLLDVTLDKNTWAQPGAYRNYVTDSIKKEETA